MIDYWNDPANESTSKEADSVWEMLEAAGVDDSVIGQVCELIDGLVGKANNAAERIAELEARQVTEWVSVKDRLPEDNEQYLVAVVGINGYEPYSSISVSQLNPVKSGFYVQYDSDGLEPIEEVTHWAPLPAAPSPADSGARS